jgi:hypothetical protein
MLLPEIDGELAYRVRNPNEPHERTAKESELGGPYGNGRSDCAGRLFSSCGARLIRAPFSLGAIVLKHEKGIAVDTDRHNDVRF